MELDDLLAELTAENTTTETPASFNEVYDKFANDLYNEVCSWSNLKREAMMADAVQRFSDALPHRLIDDVTIALVGAGGLGNWIWRVLLGMGFTNLAIFDDDKVGIENIGPQAHNMIDIDLYKVEAIRRSAMAFRGVNLRVFTKRVYSFDDIHESLGYTPDIVIGATDSATFRNALINELAMGSMGELTLFIDLRMSLGDWNAYITTPKLIADNPGRLQHIYSNYVAEACFDPEEAVQEPCTARAITYTGANVASYVGAFLHWWFTKAREYDANWFADHFYSPFRNDSATFNWAYTHSSRDFSPETQTVAQHRRIVESNINNASLDAFQKFYRQHMCDGPVAHNGVTHQAFRGISAEGHDMLRVYHRNLLMQLDLDANTVEMADTSLVVTPMREMYSYYKRGWFEMSFLMLDDWLKKNSIKLLFIGDGYAYLLDMTDGKANAYKAHVLDNKEVELGAEVPLTSLLDKQWSDYVEILENDQRCDYKLISSAHETQPQPEPQPEQPNTARLLDVPAGSEIELEGIRYIVVEHLGKATKLTADNNETYVYATSTMEVTCC